MYYDPSAPDRPRSRRQPRRPNTATARLSAALLGTLLSVPAPEATALARAAAEARWTIPRTLACLVMGEAAAAFAWRRLSGDTLHGQIDDTTCVVVPDPSLLEREARAVAQKLNIAVGLGPSVPVSEARISLRWARLALELAPGGAALVVAERRLADIALRAAPDVLAALREQALSPLSGESESRRKRLEGTLRAWLRHRGSQRAIAAELAVHPQTVRYRLRRLRELYGATLEDPDRRFELEVALREGQARTGV